jgi:DNA-binding transcriptional regulator YiaG/tetratricopeptide (TPR) repeat protein
MSESQASGGREDHELAPHQHRTGTELAEVIGRWTGANAAALRMASRKSQEAFAEQLGISTRTVAKWHQNPNAELRPTTSEILDTVLRRSSVDVQERFLILVAEGQGFRAAPAKLESVDVAELGARLSDDEDMLRRQFLRASAAALSAAGLPGLVGLRKAPRLSARNVSELETVTDVQRRLYHAVPARSIWSAVEGHLRLLIDLVRTPQPEQVHRQVAALGGEAAGLLAWLALDLGDERGRERLHDIALSLVSEARDRPLEAYVLGFRSQVRQLEGRPHAALALANQAVATAAAGRATSVHAWLKSKQAVALAEVKDRRGSMDALTAAEAALARGIVDEPAWMYEFDYTRLTAVRGECLLRLDRPAQAERAFRQALAASSHKGGRFRVELLTGLATAAARQGRVEEACGLGLESLDVASAGSELGVSRVRELRRELDRWHDSDEVAALDDRLALAYPSS